MKIGLSGKSATVLYKMALPDCYGNTCDYGHKIFAILKELEFITPSLYFI